MSFMTNRLPMDAGPPCDWLPLWSQMVNYGIVFSCLICLSKDGITGTADLETEIYFIEDVNHSVQDPVFWVRREAAFAIGALARVVPEDLVYKDLVSFTV